MKKKDVIIEKVQSGQTASRISSELGCTRQCVYNYVSENDDKLLHIVFNEMSEEELLGIQKELYFSKINYRKDRIREADEMFLKLQLVTPSEIASTLSYSKGTLYNRFRPSGDWGVWGMITQRAGDFDTPETFTRAVRDCMVHPQRLRQAMFGTNF